MAVAVTGVGVPAVPSGKIVPPRVASMKSSREVDAEHRVREDVAALVDGGREHDGRVAVHHHLLAEGRPAHTRAVLSTVLSVALAAARTTR